MSTYRVHTRTALVRSAMLPHTAVTPLFADGGPDAAFATLLADPVVDAALYVASPPLHAAVGRCARTGTWTDAKLRLRLARYLLRMGTRATPFGLFASVGMMSCTAAGEGSQTPSVELETRSQGRFSIGPDASWGLDRHTAHLADLVNRDDLLVVRNDMARTRNGRISAGNPLRIRDGDQDGTPNYEQFSIRATAPVAFILAQCVRFRRVGELIEMLVARFAQPPEVCRRLIGTLIATGVVLTDQQPNPRSPVHARLPHVPAAPPPMLPLAAAAPHVIAEFSDALNDERGVPRDQVAVRVDAYRDVVRGSLPERVLADAARLAEIYARFSEHASLPGLREAFLRRYDSEFRVVPFLELADPTAGIAVPADLTFKAPVDSARFERERRLAAHLHRALRSGGDVLRLDAGELDAVVPQRSPDQMPRAFDFSFQLLARCADDLIAGRYRITRSTVLATFSAGQMAGRFVDGLPAGVVESFENAFEDDAGTVSADLAYIPVDAKKYNVSLHRSGPHRHVIEVGFNSGHPGRIDLDDLFVGLHGERFYLWSRKLDRIVSVRERHLLSHPSAPPLARLLAMIGYDGGWYPKSFDWGVGADNAPFLPRLESGPLIVAPATWRFSAADITADRAPTSLARMLRANGVPRLVLHCEGDNKLLVDTTTELGLQLLADQAVRGGAAPVILEEWPYEGGWLTSEGAPHVAEIVVGVKRDVTAAASAPRPVVVEPAVYRRPFGSDWTYVKLYGDPARLDGFIRSELRALVRGAAPSEWHFVRYADPDWHLRLRLRMSDPSRVAEGLAGALSSHVESELIDRFSFETYNREVERYGGSDASMRAAETLFTWSSEAALDDALGDIDGRIVAALASYHSVLVHATGGDVSRWDLRLPQDGERSLDAAERVVVRKLVDAFSNAAKLTGPACDGLAILADLEQYGGRPNLLADTLDAVLHMHCNRFGLIPYVEARARRCAWHAYRSIRARRTASPVAI
jgi:lantibiotic biosynthesis protein